jgi:hypothetical protein
VALQTESVLLATAAGQVVRVEAFKGKAARQARMVTAALQAVWASQA